MTEAPLSLLSELWLSEPDADSLERAQIEAGLPLATRAELAPAYFDLFCSNVYPYGTVFLDPSGELNGPLALWTEQRFAAAGFAPRASAAVGAPDHVGLCLGLLARLDLGGHRDPEFLAVIREWIPVCALAAERESSAHPFYRGLARRTREGLLRRTERDRAPAPGPDDLDRPLDRDEELGLGEVIRFLLAPARCGFFLSRGRIREMGHDAGVELSFGSRFELARRFFEAAGQGGVVGGLIDRLTREVDEWDAAYREIARDAPSWRPWAAAWLRRLDRTRESFRAMRGIVESPPEWEYEEPTSGGGTDRPGL